MVAANVWDHAGNGGPLDAFWRAAHDLDPDAPGEAALPGTREGHLAELFRAAGLRDVGSWSEAVGARYETVDEWWATFTLGVGPAGAYVASLGDAERDALRARCVALLPAAPFEIPAVAWCATGRVA